MELNELKAYLKSLPNIIDGKSEFRVEKAQNDFKYFVLEYFPHQIGIEDIKLLDKFNERSKFRLFVYSDLDKICIQNRRVLFEAYRGSAKTTLITRLFNLWLLLTNRKKYSIVISSTLDIAVESSDTIRVELEDNAKLINDYGIVAGKKWKSEEFIFYTNKNPKKMKFFGAGKKIRGTNFLGSRPDIIVCDDIENDENVESAAQRDKLYKWFRKAVLKLPSRQSTTYNIIVVGTRLHHDGLLARIKCLSSFISYNFPLVTKFPDNIDELNADNIKTVRVINMKLDDESLDKREVLTEFFDDKESFYSEYQNEPLSKDGAIFSGYKTFEVMPLCDAYYIGIDPALGKNKGDYFAIATLGKQGKQYYLEAKGYKLKPDKMIARIIEIYMRLLTLGKPIKAAIETIAFQEFFKDRLKSEFLSRGIALSVCELKNSVAKELRLDSLAPYVTDGTILISVDSNLLIEELDTYPKAPHDDLLDASEMAFRIASSVAIADYRAINRLAKRNRTKILDFKNRYN
ncbi:phage terminase large subunit [Campylobacter sp. RM12920]|uniref:Phage terminase large subunit n=1 Tax=Campylobacter californiensis TaxID=1032243 RepID=A0ABD4JG77_9BACT|nr:phage terminase large subunit [Campylobacter sp. RM12919]MBE2987431.1 phage terminase large subunit [Campylobacter sp. RM12920]